MARSRRLDIRVTEDQLSRIKALAAENGMTVTAYMLSRALTVSTAVVEPDTQVRTTVQASAKKVQRSPAPERVSKPTPQVVEPELRRVRYLYWTGETREMAVPDWYDPAQHYIDSVDEIIKDIE